MGLWDYLTIIVILLAAGVVIHLIRQEMKKQIAADEKLLADLKESNRLDKVERDRRHAQTQREIQSMIRSPSAAARPSAPSSSTSRVSSHLRASRDDDDDTWRRNSAALHQPIASPTPSYADNWTCSGSSSFDSSSSSSSCSSDSSSSCSSSCD